VDLFIEQGVNGFYGETAAELREILLYLLNNPTETRKIGQKSRELALDIFNHDRYLQAWQETLLQLTANP
jgi:glycosyltransferase involved in cell wall biosynthesis